MLLVLLVAVLLLWSPVQTRAVGWLSDKASQALGTEVRVGRVAISLSGQLVLERIYVADLDADTLIAVGSLRVKGLRIHPRAHLVRMTGFDLDSVRFRLRTPTGGTKSNLTLLLDQLGEGDTTSASEDWTIRCARFNIEALHFTFDDTNVPRIPFGVDFNHVGVTHAHIAGRGLEVIGDSIVADLNRLHLVEQGGLEVAELSGRTAVSGKGIHIQDLHLRTPVSSADGEMRFRTGGWVDYNTFNESVVMDVDLDTARINFSDIALFAPELEGVNYPVVASGRVRGTISEMKGRGVRVAFGKRSRFSGSAELSGLPDIANTFMVLDIDDLVTDPEDLSGLPVPPFSSGARMAVPAELDRLGRIGFSGNFTGFLHAFTAYGRTTTQLGVLDTDVSYERDTVSHEFTIAGRVITPGFDLGPITGTRTFGPIATNLRVKASGRDLRTAHTDLEGTIPLITINGRRISGITTKGHLQRNLFNGELNVDDDALQLRFKGLADLRKRWPEVDFRAELDHMDLHALGFVTTPGYNSLKVALTAAGRFSPDSLLGQLSARDISYCVGDVDHELGDITLRSGRTSGVNTVELDADFATARVEGTFQPTHLPALIRNTVYSVFPAAGNEVDYQQAEQQFTFNVVTRDADAVLALVLPKLQVAPGAVISGAFDSKAFDAQVSASIPRLVYGDLHMDSVEVMTEKTVDVLAFSIRSPRQTFRDSMWFIGSEVTGLAYQDEVELSCGWAGSNSGTNGRLAIQGLVRGVRSADLDLLPSTLHLGRGDWRNAEVAHFTIDSSTVVVDHLSLNNGVQRVTASGTISRDPEQWMDIAVQEVDLANFEPFMDGPTVSGKVSGDGRLFDLYGTPYLTSYLCADGVQVEDKPVGDIRFHADWAEGSGAIALTGELSRGPLKALDFVGRMEPQKDNALDVDLVFDHFDLTFIDPYLPEGISDIQGTVTGTVDVSGNLSGPLVNGVLDLQDAGLRIDYLNTLYTFSNKVKVAPDMFALDLVTVRDEEGNTGRIGGTILHNGLKDWNFNVWGTVKDLMVLNTTVNDNSLYYGKAFANGDIEVSGSVDRLEISVDASTGPGTDIHFPVGGSTEVSDAGFVRFIAKDSSAAGEDVVDLSGIALDMKARVTPDAHFELIFDPTIGDVMAGRGTGDIEMTVSQTGEFRMRGQVEVTEGDYLFTLRNVVNKRFEVLPGGRIVWYGDPLDAQLDIQAQYRVRAPLYDIMFEKNDSYKKRVPVDVVMQLRENLMNPEIGFEVRMPTVDDDVRARVNSILSTEQERNRQVFALIVLNRFIQPQSLAGSGTPGAGGNVVGTTGFELLSNQVSNWLSKLSDDFDLGVNYRPGDNITQDELEVAMSTQFFNERLLLTTNLGVSTNAQNSNTGNGLIGDFQLEYLLTPEGRLRAKAFSVSNDRNLNRSDQAPTTQGAGVAYREDFSDWGELWQKLLNNFRPAANDRHFE